MLPERGDLDFILLESVIHGDRTRLLRAEFGADGRVCPVSQQGITRPTQLQRRAVGLNAAGTRWKSLPWDFLAPLVIPEGFPVSIFPAADGLGPWSPAAVAGLRSEGAQHPGAELSRHGLWMGCAGDPGSGAGRDSREG